MSPLPDERPELSVIAPVYESAATLSELSRRVSDALGDSAYELILVDDASPDGSRDAIEELAAADPRVRGIHLEANRGQHGAVLEGMRAAAGERIVVMDADLQDPPEAIPALLERSREGAGVVFAARRGDYEPRGRLLTSKAFKRAMSALIGLPTGAGMFMVLDRDAADRVLVMADEGPAPFVVAMAGRSGATLDSVPVERARREDGHSAYSPAARARSAARGLRWAVWRGGDEGARRRDHNERQRSYYSGEKPNMEPRPSRYLERHVDELVRFAGIKPGERVLDVGCGLGRYTLPLVKRGFRVEGIDISPDLLEKLAETLPMDAGVELHLADVLDPPEDLLGRFDAVLGGFVLHHIHDVRLSLRSMARLGRPGAALAFLEPNPFNPLYYVQMATSRTMTWEGDRGMLGMRRRPLLAAMRAAGVPDPRFERFGFYPPFIADRPNAASSERVIEGIPPLSPMLPFQLAGGRIASSYR